MKPVTVINFFLIKPGKMNQFIEVQRSFTAALKTKSAGLIGSRMYRSLDGKSAVRVAQFESARSHEGTRQSDAFEEHLKRVQPYVESANPNSYEEAFTAGNFR